MSLFCERTRGPKGTTATAQALSSPRKPSPRKEKEVDVQRQLRDGCRKTYGLRDEYDAVKYAQMSEELVFRNIKENQLPEVFSFTMRWRVVSLECKKVGSWNVRVYPFVPSSGTGIWGELEAWRPQMLGKVRFFLCLALFLIAFPLCKVKVSNLTPTLKIKKSSYSSIHFGDCSSIMINIPESMYMLGRYKMLSALFVI